MLGRLSQEAVRNAIAEGIEDAAATIVGPFLPLIDGLPGLVSVVAGEIVEQLTPLQRAALVYELRYVEELCTALWNEYNELGGDNALDAPGGLSERAMRLKVRLEAYGHRAEEIRDALWPDAHVVEVEAPQ